MVKERGARVVFECQRALVKLLSVDGTRERLGLEELVGEEFQVPSSKFQVGGEEVQGPKSKVQGQESGEHRGQATGDRRQGQQLPEFDFQVPLLSLPGIFGTRLETIPAEAPYLFA